MKSLQARLFRVYLGSALLIALLFTLVSYGIAQDAARQQEADHLTQVVGALSQAIRMADQQHARDSQALETMLQPLVPENGILWLQHQTQPLVLAATPQVDAELQAKIAGLNELTLIEDQGDFRLGGRHWLWARSTDSATGSTLLVAQPYTISSMLLLKVLPLKVVLASSALFLVAIVAASLTTTSITRRVRRQHDHLVHQALHDSLTDLPNRHLLYDRLDQALHHSFRHDTSMALFILDLDRFKDINDTLGHHIGDEVLKTVSHRLRESVGRDATVARLGGDEFAVLLPEADQVEAVSNAKTILGSLDQPITIDGVRLEAKPSIGIAIYPEHGTETETLLQHADVAMYQAKRNRLGLCLYEKGLDPHSMRRLTLVTDLRKGIGHDQLVLFYQPKVDLASGRTLGVEALVRWEHPTLGLLAPEEFIELAEQNGLINMLTDWVLTEAIYQCSQWRKDGLELTIAVNLSAYNLQNPALLDNLRKTLEIAGLPGHYLELELTESAMMTDMNRAMEVFSELAAMDVKLAIDDFGTGMSSLSYLQRLPMDELKIDKSFVTDMAENEHNRVIVRSIIDLAHNIDRSVVAEGVQDRDVLELLQEMGCDRVQGYFISRPRRADELARWINNSAWGINNISDRLNLINNESP